MTTLDTVFDSFESKITEDEWSYWTKEEIRADERQLLYGAIARFKFPHIKLDIVDDSFANDLSINEQQILASYMMLEWLNRNINSWNNIKPLYDERDYSPANMLDKLTNHLNTEKKFTKELEDYYHRTVNGKPYPYSKLAGNNG